MILPFLHGRGQNPPRPPPNSWVGASGCMRAVEQPLLLQKGGKAVSCISPHEAPVLRPLCSGLAIAAWGPGWQRKPHTFSQRGSPAAAMRTWCPQAMEAGRQPTGTPETSEGWSKSCPPKGQSHLATHILLALTHLGEGVAVQQHAPRSWSWNQFTFPK